MRKTIVAKLPALGHDGGGEALTPSPKYKPTKHGPKALRRGARPSSSHSTVQALPPLQTEPGRGCTIYIQRRVSHGLRSYSLKLKQGEDDARRSLPAPGTQKRSARAAQRRPSCSLCNAIELQASSRSGTETTDSRMTPARRRRCRKDVFSD